VLCLCILQAGLGWELSAPIGGGIVKVSTGLVSISCQKRGRQVTQRAECAENRRKVEASSTMHKSSNGSSMSMARFAAFLESLAGMPDEETFKFWRSGFGMSATTQRSITCTRLGIGNETRPNNRLQAP